MTDVFSIRKIIYIIGFFLIIIPACDMRKEYTPMLSNIGICLIMSVSIISGYKRYNLYATKIELLMWAIWIILIVSLFPAYLSGNISTSIIYEHILMFLLYFLILPKSDIKLWELSFAAVFVNLYIAYRCVFELGISHTYYQGTMTNPNQMALVLIGGGIGSLYLIISCKRKREKIIGLISFIITATLLFYTSSRTMMIALVIALLVYVIFYINNKLKKSFGGNHKISRKFFAFCSVFLILTLMLIIYFHKNISSFLFDKWNNNGSRLLSGRTEIWGRILKNISLVGDYNSSINANNDFLDWLIKYGIISFVIYIILVIAIIVLTVRRFKKKKTEENLWALIIVVCYIFICMFENVHALFGKSINIIFWSTSGFIMRKEMEINNK